MGMRTALSLLYKRAALVTTGWTCAVTGSPRGLWHRLRTGGHSFSWLLQSTNVKGHNAKLRPLLHLPFVADKQLQSGLLRGTPTSCHVSVGSCVEKNTDDLKCVHTELILKTFFNAGKHVQSGVLNGTPTMMMIIRTTHYLVHAAHEALRQFSVSMSFCRLLIPVVC